MLDLADHRDPQPALARGTRQLQRDPVEVLRMWPHSAASDPGAAPRATLRAASTGGHLDDKIKLAHLALDLYRELEGLQVAARGGLAVGQAADCADPSCATRTSALRGALVEACLLVQRMALLAPTAATTHEVDDRVRDLLAMIGR